MLKYLWLGVGGMLALAQAACGSGGSGGGVQLTATATSPPFTPPALETITAPATKTTDGLQIVDIKVGEGDVAQAGDIVYITFNLWLADGTWKDTTTLKGTPVPERQNLRSGQVIKGFLEGIPGMKVGGKRRLVIPAELGYGSTGSGNAIPPNATLIYDIELVQASHPQTP